MTGMTNSIWLTCMRLPEVRSARRFRLDHGLSAGLEPQPAPFDSLALYEIESEDPDAVARALAGMAGTLSMPLSEALDRSATMRAIATAAGVRP
jgi:hypothetical protein